MEREFLEVSQRIPRSLPVLDRWMKRHGGARPLAGVTALLIQHQFGDQVPMAQALMALGLEPKRLIWLDVPYTSNARVRAALVRLHIPRRNLLVADDYRILEPYASYQRRRVQALVRRFLDDPPKQLLVLDDGAYFVEAAACFKDQLPHVAVVEQTSRGVFKIRASAAMTRYASTIPIVNVAGSIPKRTLESPFIGRAVCAALRRRLGRRLSPGRRGRCLILGFGAIGTEVAHFVAKYLRFTPRQIFVWDPDRRRRRAAYDRGYSAWRRRDEKVRFKLVIGCSGRASFSVHDYVYLENEAVLASASSGSVELSREEFIELADSSRIDDIKVLRREFDRKNLHSDLRLQFLKQKATFLNGGFPVNFTGCVNAIPARYIQATATMMVAAAVQAVSSSGRGLIPLNRNFCDWLDREFRAELAPDAPGLLGLPKKTRKGAGRR